MRATLVINLLLLFMFGSYGQDAELSIAKYKLPPCICYKIYRPVCCKGKTHGNDCMAKCAGCKNYKPGRCGDKPKPKPKPKPFPWPPKQPCYCPAVYQPVCCNGKQFGNGCEASCEGKKNCDEGPCVKIVDPPPPKECRSLALCKRNPCDKCPGFQCDWHTCGDGKIIFGQKIGPCQAIYKNIYSGQVFKNTCPAKIYVDDVYTTEIEE